MQRIALACLGVVAISGCAVPEVRVVDPLPAPILETRAVVRRMPPAPPPRPAVSPRPVSRASTVQPADIAVPGLRAGRWDVIVVHHSAQAASTPASMDRYHRQVRHWENGLGYDFVIGNGVNTRDGALHVGPRWRNQETGAHCKTGPGRFLGRLCPDNYFNEHGIGICLIGNFEHERPTAAQMRTLVDLICTLCRELDIDPRYVYGHGEITGHTLCPGRHFDMASLRRAVQQRFAELQGRDPLTR